MRLSLRLSAANKPHIRRRSRTPKHTIPASSVKIHAVPVVALRNAKIYEQHPASVTDPGGCIFPQLSFSLDSARSSRERWAVISDDSSVTKTKFLQTLRAQYISIPPTSRSWPYLSSDEYIEENGGVAGEPSRKLRYVGFTNLEAKSSSSSIQGAYLGARYESRREDTDWTLLDYLRGTVSLNLSSTEVAAARKLEEGIDFQRIITDLKLRELLALPVGNLSNGQNRRARIAKALLERPEVLLLDEPFAGLDPVNHRVLATLLKDLAEKSNPRVLLALQAQEPVPDWVTDVVALDPDGNMVAYGNKDQVLPNHQSLATEVYIPRAIADGKATRGPYKGYRFSDPDMQSRLEERRLRGSQKITKFTDGRMHGKLSEFDKKKLVWERYPGFVTWDQYDSPKNWPQAGEPLVEMTGVKVSYGSKCVLGDWQVDQDAQLQEGLHWTVRKGERWGVFGANGSGKTTLMSLLTSDHPQAYSLPIKLFGRSRLPAPSQPGISIFDLQARIGHSSPEVHTHFPKHYTIRQVVENAWAEAFHDRPKLSNEIDESVNAALRWFRHELDPSVATQRDSVQHTFGDAMILRTRTEPYLERGFMKSRLLRWLHEEPDWADKYLFRESGLSAQRVALFLRAVIKKPDIVILDEAFSGMDEAARLKCMLWLAHGEEKWVQRARPQSGTVRPKTDTPMRRFGLLRHTGLEARQAVICVSHRKEEVPFIVDRFLRLPESNEGKPARFGEIDRHNTRDWWENIWV